MEHVLEDLDRRLNRIEQILPTLATRDDVQEARGESGALFEEVIDRLKVLGEG